MKEKEEKKVILSTVFCSLFFGFSFFFLIHKVAAEGYFFHYLSWYFVCSVFNKWKKEEINFVSLFTISLVYLFTIHGYITGTKNRRRKYVLSVFLSLLAFILEHVSLFDMSQCSCVIRYRYIRCVSFWCYLCFWAEIQKKTWFICSQHSNIPIQLRKCISSAEFYWFVWCPSH